MIRRALNIALTLALAAGASAQALAQSGQSGLPAGHPALPPGSGASSLPPAQPQGGAGNLPQGHPAVGSSSKAVAHGSITLHVNQGTANGTKLAGDAVSIDLYSAAPAPLHYAGTVDANGMYNLADVTIPGACQPLIKVTHAGVAYQGIGEVMDAAHPDLKVEVRVFDITDAAPQWSIKIRHVILHRTPAGLDVTEMIMLNNPGDRVWSGVADAKGGHYTMALPLPAAAQNVQFGDGLKDGNASVKDGQLFDAVPLMPGETQIQFSYTLPVTDGKAQIVLSAPVAVGHLMMFVPDDGSTVTGDGLIPAGAGDAAGGKMRFFMVPSLPLGKVLTVDLAHIAGPAAKAAADDSGAGPGAMTSSAAASTTPMVPEPAPRRSKMPVILGVGSAVLLVGGTIAIFARPAPQKRA